MSSLFSEIGERRSRDRSEVVGPDTTNNLLGFLVFRCYKHFYFIFDLDQKIKMK
jgi:hypothetical protein